MAHLACFAHRRGELVEILERYAAAGVENVLAVRGDPAPRGDRARRGGRSRPRDRPRRAREVGGAVLRRRRRPPRGAPGRPGPCERPAPPRRQARRGRLRDHPVLLPGRRLPAPRRGPRAPWGSTSRSSRGSCRSRTSNRSPAWRSCPAPPSRGRGHRRGVDRVAEDPEAVRAVGIEVATELCRDLIAAGRPGVCTSTR